jgi:hypothetical protein
MLKTPKIEVFEDFLLKRNIQAIPASVPWVSGP